MQRLFEVVGYAIEVSLCAENLSPHIVDAVEVAIQRLVVGSLNLVELVFDVVVAHAILGDGVVAAGVLGVAAGLEAQSAPLVF